MTPSDPAGGGVTLTLTVIDVDPSHREVRADLRDPCRMHARVLQLLALDPEVPRSRELWAARPTRLLVQHEHAADPRWLPDGYARGHSTRPVRLDWAAGERVRWAWTVNPTWQARTRVDGERRGGGLSRTVRVDPVEWATSRLSAAVDVTSASLVDRRKVGGRKSDGRRVTIDRAVVTGTGTVVDSTMLADIIRSGRGHGKAYGCGLLIVDGEPA